MPPKKKRGPGRPPGSSKRKKSLPLNDTTDTNATTTGPNNATNNATGNNQRNKKVQFQGNDNNNDNESKSNKRNIQNESKKMKWNNHPNINNNDNNPNPKMEDFTMYAIPHHTSFIPALQYPNPLITLHQYNPMSTTNTTSTTTTMTNNKSNIITTTTIENTLSSDTITNYNLYHPRNLSAQSIPTIRDDIPFQTPYSAGCRLSSMAFPSWRNIPQSTIYYHNDDIYNDNNTDVYSNNNNNDEKVIKCTTVMNINHNTSTTATHNNKNYNSNYIAMGDTAGYITLYSILPLIRPICVLDTSSSKRNCKSHYHQIYQQFEVRNRRLNRRSSVTKSHNDQNGDDDHNDHDDSNQVIQSSLSFNNQLKNNLTNHTTTSGGSGRKPKKIGVTSSILMSTIDRNYAIECIAVCHNCVVIGTKYEVEYITIDNHIRWSLDITNHLRKSKNDDVDNRIDNNCNTNENSKEQEEENVVQDFVCKRFDIGNGGILASFEIQCTTSTSVRTSNTTNTVKEIQLDGEASSSSSPSSLSSPVWHIDTKSGKTTNVIPKEYVNNKFQDTTVGHKGTAIWDKSIPYANNILAVFITITKNERTASPSSPSNNTTTSSSTTTTAMNETQKQELFLLNNSHQVIFKTELPTKMSGSKIITCEAINQSQRGTFTIAATSAKGGIRLFKTDGLVHLGTYGEGVSLHGHSIFWNDCFFVDMGSGNHDYAYNNKAIEEKYHKTNKTLEETKSKRKRSANTYYNSKDDNDDDDGLDLSCDQEQWGQIFECRDELRHRGTWKDSKIERIKTGEEETLRGLHIVSVPHPFREPVDMKETIHFWDVTACEIDGGNKLPSFTLAAPKKSGGIVSFLHDQSLPTSHGSRFMLSTYEGDCVQLTPTMTSDWSGQMYPTGFRVIDNNLVYIEDEDELDKVIDGHLDEDGLCKVANDSWGSPIKKRAESELEEALRLSKVDENIDVINDDEMDDVDVFFMTDGEAAEKNGSPILPPCRPELRLKPTLIKDEDDTDEKSRIALSLADDANSRCDAIDILHYFPQHKIVEDELESEKLKIVKRKQLVASKLENTDDLVKEKTPKPKGRLAMIEANINASTDKNLSISMLQRENFAEIKGSFLINDLLTNNFCAACRGRKVIHSCGKRVKPIDYDAIEAARKAKEEKERKAKLAAAAKKREETKAKKKEAQRQQLEAERIMKMEEEKIKKEMAEQARSALIDEQPNQNYQLTGSNPFTDSNIGARQQTVPISDEHDQYLHDQEDYNFNNTVIQNQVYSNSEPTQGDYDDQVLKQSSMGLANNHQMSAGFGNNAFDNQPENINNQQYFPKHDYTSEPHEPKKNYEYHEPYSANSHHNFNHHNSHKFHNNQMNGTQRQYPQEHNMYSNEIEPHHYTPNQMGTASYYPNNTGYPYNHDDSHHYRNSYGPPGTMNGNTYMDQTQQSRSYYYPPNG